MTTPGPTSTDRRRLLEILLRKEGIDVAEVPLPRPSGATAPLSYAQERLWRTGRLVPGTPFGNLPLVFRLTGELDPDALEKALRGLVERHEVLRTVFPVVDGRPVQVVRPASEVSIQHEEVREAEAERFRKEAERVFRPEEEPCFRALLARSGEREWTLGLFLHHLVSDGWGLRILLGDLGLLYRRARGEADTPPPEPLPIQYADYALWQREWLAGDRVDEEVEYWTERLRGAPPFLALPTEGAASPRPDFSSRDLPLEIPAQVSAACRALAREEGVTLFSVLLAAFQMILAHYSDGSSVVAGTTASSRTRRGTDGLVGNFGNNLLLHTDLSGVSNFRELVRRTGAVVVDAFTRPELPLEVLVEKAAQGSGLRVPAFQLMFLLRQGSLEESLDLPSVDTERMPVEVGMSPLELTLDLVDSGERLTGKLTYRTERLGEEAMRRLADAYLDVLGRHAARPDSELEWPTELPPPSERIQLKRGPASSVERASGLTDTERVLVELWQDVLGDVEIGPTDNFYDLGGHSLAAAGVISRMEERIGVTLDPVEFGFQTLAQIARMCEDRRSDGNATADAADMSEVLVAEESKPLSPGMRPLFFPTSSGPLYGVLHHATDRVTQDRAALLCPPASLEYTATHRALRVLAERLSAAGIPALRFDWRGTGDSWDIEDRHPPSLDDWREDVQTAAGWLRETTGVDEIVPIGVRLGAAVALLELASHRNVSSLILWSPVIDQEDQIRSLELGLAESRAGITSEGSVSMLALPAPEGLSDLDLLTRPGAYPPKVLLVSSKDTECRLLAERIRKAGSTVDEVVTPDASVWRQFANVEERVPPRTVKVILRWISSP